VVLSKTFTNRKKRTDVRCRWSLAVLLCGLTVAADSFTSTVSTSEAGSGPGVGVEPEPSTTSLPSVATSDPLAADVPLPPPPVDPSLN